MIVRRISWWRHDMETLSTLLFFLCYRLQVVKKVELSVMWGTITPAWVILMCRRKYTPTFTLNTKHHCPFNYKGMHQLIVTVWSLLNNSKALSRPAMYWYRSHSIERLFKFRPLSGKFADEKLFPLLLLMARGIYVNTLYHEQKRRHLKRI